MIPGLGVFGAGGGGGMSASSSAGGGTASGGSQGVHIGGIQTGGQGVPAWAIVAALALAALYIMRR